MPTDRVSEAVRLLREECGLVADPGRRGPVLLDRFFEAANLNHAAVGNLSTATVTEYLIRERYVSGPDVVDDFPVHDHLDGFLFWVGGDGLALVNAGDILPRRRFTAAHELGHARLHRQKMPRYAADVTVSDSDDTPDEWEREANRFAAELLMPEEVVRAREAELKAILKIKVCPRVVLANRLASELLVSLEAMRYRLKALGVGDDD